LAADELPQSQDAIVAGHRANTGRHTKGQCQWQGNYTGSDASVNVSTNIIAVQAVDEIRFPCFRLN